MTSRYRTPLRYPGGKQKLYPFIAELIDRNGISGGHYAEPYAGGAGVAIALLLDGIVSHVHLNDCSIHIYAVWHSIKEHPDELCRRISSASLNIDEWKRHREVFRHPESHDVIDLGFSTFYLNRCNRSGILSAGAIGGLAQEGKWRIDARFPRNELIQRIEAIAERSDCVTVTRLDAEDFLRNHVNAHLPENALVYCDPPYYERAQRLYLDTYQIEDHKRLADLIQNELAYKWLVSYDQHPDIIGLYKPRKKLVYSLQYSAIRAYKSTEILVFSDDLAMPEHSEIPAIDSVLSTKITACGH